MRGVTLEHAVREGRELANLVVPPGDQFAPHRRLRISEQVHCAKVGGHAWVERDEEAVFWRLANSRYGARNCA